MIVLDISCDGAHRFEGWFASRAAFDDQRGRELVACPVCGSVAVDVALSVPRIGGTRSNVTKARTPRDVLRQVATLQAALLPKSTWVGSAFAEQARAIADGEAEPALIHGQATPAEAQALHDDGVPVMPLIVPVVPPEQQN